MARSAINSKWDTDPVFCPLGHERLICQRVKIYKNPRWFPVYYCVIERRRVDRELWRKKYPKALARRRHNDDDQIEDELARSGVFKPEREFVKRGNWMSPGGPIVYVILTCRHELMFQRASFDPESVFYCGRCDDLKFVHQYTAKTKGDLSFYVFVLDEVPPSCPAQKFERWEEVPPSVTAHNNMFERVL